MSWWYVSSRSMTCAVQLDDNDTVVTAPPILRRFVGQPARNLGDWLRQQGAVEFTRIGDLDYTYMWGNNEKRETMKGRPCRVVARGARRSVLIEFADGQREVVSYRSLRKENT